MAWVGRKTTTCRRVAPQVSEPSRTRESRTTTMSAQGTPPCALGIRATRSCLRVHQSPVSDRLEANADLEEAERRGLSARLYLAAGLGADLRARKVAQVARRRIVGDPDGRGFAQA